MDREILPILMKAFIDSMSKEGKPISEQSVVSTLEPILDALESAKSLTPTQRHALAADRHIEDACKERDRMARELAAAHESHQAAIRTLRQEFMVGIQSHRDRLDWFEPNYEGLKREYDSIRRISTSSLVMITLGSVLMTLAGFLATSLKFPLLAAGIVATLYGLWVQWFVVSNASPSQERPAVSGQGQAGPTNPRSS